MLWSTNKNYCNKTLCYFCDIQILNHFGPTFTLKCWNRKKNSDGVEVSVDIEISDEIEFLVDIEISEGIEFLVDIEISKGIEFSDGMKFSDGIRF